MNLWPIEVESLVKNKDTSVGGLRTQSENSYTFQSTHCASVLSAAGKKKGLELYSRSSDGLYFLSGSQTCLSRLCNRRNEFAFAAANGATPVVSGLR